MVGYPGVVSTCCVQALCPVKVSACRPLLMNLTVGVSTGQRVSKGSMISCLAVFEGSIWRQYLKGLLRDAQESSRWVKEKE